jgi:UDP-GlcNAc:undecaprenyl-phosphate GlcNAc-1-phosphate transferase
VNAVHLLVNAASEYVQPFLLGLILSLTLTPLSRRLAVRVGAIDQPGARRVHLVATPRLGGPALLCAMMIAVVAAAMLGASMPGSEWRMLRWAALGALMVTLVGAADDIRPVRAVTKLLIETAAAGAAVYGGLRVDLPPVHHLEMLSFPLTVFFIVSTVNAINLIDGLDGLAVGSCLIMSAILLALCRFGGQPAMLPAASCGVMAGFLWYNFHPARIFLGDSGALLLGFIVAIGAISASHQPTGGAGGFAMFAPFVALGFPLGELALTIIRRAARVLRIDEFADRARRYRLKVIARPTLFSADRDHIHHRLLARGFSHRSSVLVLYGLGAAIGAAAILMATRRSVSAGGLIVTIVAASVIGARALGYRELMPLKSGLLLPSLEACASARRIFWIPVDVTFIIAALFAARCVQNGWTATARPASIVAIVLIGLVQIAILLRSDIYGRSWREAGIDDAIAVMRAVGLAAAAEALIVIVWPTLSIGFVGVVVDTYILATIVPAGRLSFRIVEHLFQREEPMRLETEWPAATPGYQIESVLKQGAEHETSREDSSEVVGAPQ